MNAALQIVLLINLDPITNTYADKKSFFSSFVVVFNQMLFHFQINLTQRPVLHLYNDLINEAFQNVKGGSRINIEKELERYSKYSRSKTMFDY